MLTKGTDFSVALEDHPGALAKATEVIANSGVNIDGICGTTDGGPTVHFLFIKDPAKAREAFEAAGIKVKKEREVVLTDVADRPGAASAELRKIAQHEINIDLAYLATSNRLVFGAKDVQALWTALAPEMAKART